MTKKTRLGDLQLAIMRVLWTRGEASAADVCTALYRARKLAPTTISTMLKKMEAKGVVSHHSEGRRFIYRPAVTEEEVTQSMVSDLTSRLFSGDASALVSHLISKHELGADDLAEIKQIIRKAEKDRKQ